MDACDSPGLRGGDGPSDGFGDIVSFGNMNGSSLPVILSLRECPLTIFGGVSILTRLFPLGTSIAGPSTGGEVAWFRFGDTGDMAALNPGTDEFELPFIGDAGRIAGVEPPGVE